MRRRSLIECEVRSDEWMDLLTCHAQLTGYSIANVSLCLVTVATVRAAAEPALSSQHVYLQAVTMQRIFR